MSLLKPRPASEAAAAASRRNGRLSTGPATPAGRLRIAGSNTRHGFFARAVLLRNEDAAAFEALTKSLIDRLHPADPYELRLVRAIAASAWRLERLYEIQTADLEERIDRQVPSIEADFESIDEETRTALAFREMSTTSYHRYESALILQQKRALALLREWRGLGELQSGLPEYPANSLNPQAQKNTSQESTNGADDRSREAA